MKKNRFMYTLTAAVCASSLLLGGCGSSSSTSSYASDDVTAEYYYDGLNSYDSDFEAAGTADSSMKSASVSTDDIGSGAAGTEDYSQKLIYTYNYTFETLDYDASMDFIRSKVEEYGGYIENYSSYGSQCRDADMTLRIPKEHIDDFLNQTGSIGEIINQDISATDVTLDYYDVASRLESLNAKHQRLLELMEKAETLTDIAALESELSDCEYQIDSYESQLKIYDNQVDYVTVYISLYEVEQVSTIESDSILTRIQKGLAANTAGLADNIVNIVVWLIISLPYIFFLVILVLVVLFVIRKIKRHRAARLAGKAAQTVMNPVFTDSQNENENGSDQESK